MALAVGTGPDVACVGDNCVDVYSDEVAPRNGGGHEFAGGNAFNVAVELARLGCGVSYFGAVGVDPQAELIISAARAAGVDLAPVRRVPGATGRTVVARDEFGERRFVSEDYGVAASYRLDDGAADTVARHRWAHFCRQRDLGAWAPRLRERGTLTSCDLGVPGGFELLEPLASHLDVVFLSSSASPERSGQELLQAALQAGAGLAVVTLGAAGSVAAVAGRQWQAEALAVDQVVDSLGAGDAFIAAFIAARLAKRGVDDALRAGALAGSLACTRWGLASPLPTDEVTA